MVRRFAVLVVALLAGCSSDPHTEQDEPLDGTIRGAVIEASINGTQVAPVNGTISTLAGTLVTFNGSASVGAEGVYQWAFGDNGTADGAVVSHAFGPGAFTVTLTVGANGTASGSLRVDAAQPPPASGLPLGAQPFDFSGNLPLGNPNSPTNAGTDYRDHVVTITDTFNGSAAVARAVSIRVESSGGAVDTFVYWRSPDGENLASDQASGTDKELVYEGSMPPGDYVVRVRVFVGADVDYSVDGEVRYETP